MERKMIFGTRRQVAFLIIYLFFAAAANAYDYDPNDFAIEVVSSKGLAGTGLYDDPQSVLGKPTTWIYDYWEELTYACSLAFAAYETDPNDNKLITTIADGAEIVVKFSHKVADDPGNPHGIDFTVFGNTFFEGDDWVYPDTNMETHYFTNPASVNAEQVMVSVAQGPNGPWFPFANGPYGDTAFPTNAFAWDRDANNWGEELNWLKPVDPNLSLSAFDGLSAADAIDLYDGSAGGTGFDLKDLAPGDYEALTADPNTDQKWIQYIKVEFLPDSPYDGEIDGFADVAGCGDYKHPYPVGDLDENCRVDYEDCALLCRYWLAQITDPNEPAAIADIYEDDIVNFHDWALLAGSWLQCSWECQ